MTTIRAVYRNGQVVLDGPPPADWPDELSLRIEPDPDDQPMTPEQIERQLALMDEMEVPDPERGEELARILRDNRAWQIAQWENWWADLERVPPRRDGE